MILIIPEGHHLTQINLGCTFALWSCVIGGDCGLTDWSVRVLPAPRRRRAAGRERHDLLPRDVLIITQLHNSSSHLAGSVVVAACPWSVRPLRVWSLCTRPMRYIHKAVCHVSTMQNPYHHNTQVRCESTESGSTAQQLKQGLSPNVTGNNDFVMRLFAMQKLKKVKNDCILIG